MIKHVISGGMLTRDNLRGISRSACMPPYVINAALFLFWGRRKYISCTVRNVDGRVGVSRC